MNKDWDSANKIFWERFNMLSQAEFDDYFKDLGPENSENPWSPSTLMAGKLIFNVHAVGLFVKPRAVPHLKSKILKKKPVNKGKKVSKKPFRTDTIVFVPGFQESTSLQSKKNRNLRLNPQTLDHA